jgi:hypothetical protein
MCTAGRCYGARNKAPPTVAGLSPENQSAVLQGGGRAILRVPPNPVQTAIRLMGLSKVRGLPTIARRVPRGGNGFYTGVNGHFHQLPPQRTDQDFTGFSDRPGRQ